MVSIPGACAAVSALSIAGLPSDRFLFAGFLPVKDKARAEVLEGFVEFKPFIGHCKFRDCSHRHEPGCAILAALEAGTISATRMDSYRYILRTLNEN